LTYIEQIKAILLFFVSFLSRGDQILLFLGAFFRSFLSMKENIRSKNQSWKSWLQADSKKLEEYLKTKKIKLANSWYFIT
jgi:hypothetical protein